MTTAKTLLAQVARVDRPAVDGGKAGWDFLAGSFVDPADAKAQELAFRLLESGMKANAAFVVGAPEGAAPEAAAHANGKKNTALVGRLFQSPDDVRRAARSWLKAHPDAASPFASRASDEADEVAAA